MNEEMSTSPVTMETSCCCGHQVTWQPLHHHGYHAKSQKTYLHNSFYRSSQLILLCVILLGQPVFTSRMINLPLHHVKNIQSSSHSLHRRSARSAGEGVLHGQPGQGYYVTMAIGTPPQYLNVLVDTGSSNFAVASSPHPDLDLYFHTENSSSYSPSLIPTTVAVPYTQGDWVGSLGQEVVTLDNLTVHANVAFITESENFFINGSGWQGILGLAYPDIARPDSSVDPYFTTLIHDGHVSGIFSIQMCSSSTEGPGMAGNLVLGGIDNTLYKGDIYYVPLYKAWYYEIVITDVAVNQESVDLDCKEYNFDKTIVDSGTTNLRLPKLVFSKLLRKVQINTNLAGQVVPDVFWSGDDLLCWPPGDTPWFSFPSIELTLAMTSNTTVTLTLSPQQYLRRVTEDVDVFGGTSVIEDQNCYKFAISPSETGTVLGAVVMEAFYVVFDQETSRVGFAVGTCGNLSPESIHPKITGPQHSGDTSDCGYKKPPDHQGSLLIAAYVMAAVCGLCLLPLTVAFVYWQLSKCRGEESTPPGDSHDHRYSAGLLKDDSDT